MIRIAALAIGILVAAFTLVDNDVKVTDGDSLIVGGKRVRLYGVDAPELDQTCLDANHTPYRCGVAARTYLLSLILNKRVECLTGTIDIYNRIIATCSVDGKDLGEQMVRAGMAIDYARYSKGVYAAAEAEARENLRGIWQGLWDQPESFRRMKAQRR
jgi:endonuclease YncB( thermonuclease family)